MAKEEVLIDVEINQGQTEEDINKITKSLVFLNAEQKDLLAINKSLEKSGEVLSSQYIENTKTIEKNKNEISKQTAERKVLVKALDLENNSIGALEDSSKRLTKERRDLDLSTKEGVARLKEINNELDDNKESLDKAKGATGSWKDSIDGVIPGFKGVADGIQAGTKAAIAFIATPLGLTLAAIAAVAAPVIAFFKGTGDGADKLTEIFAVLSAAGNVLMDRFSNLGRTIFEAINNPKQAIIDLGNLIKENLINRIVGLVELVPKLGEAISLAFSGQFAAAGEVAVNALAKVSLGVEDLTGKLSDLGTEIIEESKAALDLARALDALEDREKVYELQLSKTTLKIKELRAASKDRSLSEEERMELLDRALKLEIKQAEELTAIRIAQRDLVLKEIDDRTALDRKQGESAEAFMVRVIEEGRITDELRDKGIAAIQAVDVAKGQSLVLQEQIQNQINALYEKDVAAKQAAADKKAAADQKELAARAKAYQEADKKRIAEIQAQNEEVDRMAVDAFNKEQKLLKFTTDAQIGGLNLITKEKSAARVVGTALLKKDTLKEIAVSTKAGAIAAYKSLAGIPLVGPALGAVAAGLVIAYGAVQAAGVTGVSFEKGGSVDDKIGRGKGFTIGGRSHLQGGTEFRGSDGSRFIAQSNEGLFILNREAHRDFISEQSNRNLKHGGRSWNPSYGTKSFELGGQFIQSQQSGVSASDIIDIVTAAISSLPPSVVLVEDINTGQSRVSSVESKSNLLGT